MPDKAATLAIIIDLCKKASAQRGYDHPDRVMLPDRILRFLGQLSVFDETVARK